MPARDVWKPDEWTRGLARRKITYAKTRAFTVHILTASGAFLAFLSVVAAAESRWTAMFFWLGTALLVDGIDGPIARRLDVKTILPNWSGDMLDNVIDYTTYVMIPAFALYGSGLVGEPWSFVAAGIIVVTSAIYYADTQMKTRENFFIGFPVVWNMVVFTLFVVQPGPLLTMGLVLASAVMTFLPLHFLHPVRVERLRRINLACFFLWCGFGVVALLYALSAPRWVAAGMAATAIYLYLIGIVMQIFPGLGKRERAQ